MAAAVSETPVIRDDESYLVDEFCKRVGLGKWGFRKAKANGLRTIQIHGRRYVRGRDWNAYLDAQAADQASA